MQYNVKQHCTVGSAVGFVSCCNPSAVPTPAKKRAKPDLWAFVTDEVLSTMSDKRKTEIDRGPDAKKARTGGGDNIRVLPQRVRALKAGAVGAGPVIYWYDMPYKHPSTTALTLRHGHTLLHNTNRMSRDQRVQDNWALLHAVELASKTGSPVAVAFNLVPAFLGAGARHFGFMLRGLRELDAALAALGIPFFLLKGEPEATLPELVQASNAAALVTDYSPLRLGRTWREQVGMWVVLVVSCMCERSHMLFSTWCVCVCMVCDAHT